MEDAFKQLVHFRSVERLASSDDRVLFKMAQKGLIEMYEGYIRGQAILSTSNKFKVWASQHNAVERDTNTMQNDLD